MSNNPYEGPPHHDYTHKYTQNTHTEQNKSSFTNPTYSNPRNNSNPYHPNTNTNDLLNQPTFKEKNKAMYSSTMQFSNSSSQGFTSLESMGKMVSDETRAPHRDDFTSHNYPNHQQSTQTYFKQYSGYSGNQPNTSESETTKFSAKNYDRFPVANLNPSKGINEAKTQSSSSSTSVNPNQTPEQKRKRQILQIKKQLDDLNKKMVERTNQKKAEGTQPEQPIPKYETRQKNSAVSQSLIFQSKYTQPGMDTTFKTSNPISSIDELYAKQKGANRKGSYQEQQQPKGNTYIQSNKPSYEPMTQKKYGQETNVTSNFDNKYLPKTIPNKSDNEIPSYQKYQPYSQPESFKQNTESKYTANYQPTKSNSNDYSVPTFKKMEEPVMGFKKKKQQPAVYQVNQNPISSITKEPAMEGIGLKRTNSDVDNSNQPKLKQFKKSDFAIGKKLGKGQFGEVMIVRHKETGFLCGLKVMEKKQIRDEQYVGQIARELSIQFYLSHRNVAPLYGYFSDKDYVYLLIQYCIGGQLLERLRGERRMNERDVALIMKQVCQGIDYIHKQLIIHRDIKPENILFNFGIVKISDFGWAVYRGHGLRKTASGSPLYYPPEIVKGEEYDDKIDVWNIGMMTYECLLGKIPFRIYTEMDLDRIVSDDITFPSWVDVTDEAKDFILKTMRKKGEERMEIRQMLRHPFLTKQKDSLLDQSIMEQFKRVLS